MQMQKEAEESAAAAEEALQKSATLEEKLQKEQEFSAWLVQQRAKVKSRLMCCCFGSDFLHRVPKLLRIHQRGHQ